MAEIFRSDGKPLRLFDYGVPDADDEDAQRREEENVMGS